MELYQILLVPQRTRKTGSTTNKSSNKASTKAPNKQWIPGFSATPQLHHFEYSGEITSPIRAQLRLRRTLLRSKKQDIHDRMNSSQHAKKLGKDLFIVPLSISRREFGFSDKEKNQLLVLDHPRDLILEDDTDNEICNGGLNRMRGTKSINESLDRYTKLFQPGVSEEADSHHSKSLRLSKEGQVPSRELHGPDSIPSAPSYTRCLVMLFLSRFRLGIKRLIPVTIMSEIFLSYQVSYKANASIHGTHQSPDQPLNPSLFKELEILLHPRLERSSIDELGTKCDDDHRLVFDLVNEALVEIISRNLAFKPEYDQSLDDIVGRDLENDAWMIFQPQAESVALELEDLIFVMVARWEPLVGDAVKSARLLTLWSWDRVPRWVIHNSDCQRSFTEAALNLALGQPTTLPPPQPITYGNMVSYLRNDHPAQLVEHKVLNIGVVGSHGGHFIIQRSPTEAALNLTLGQPTILPPLTPLHMGIRIHYGDFIPILILHGIISQSWFCIGYSTKSFIPVLILHEIISLS
ncbi:Detected protein of unknown function [Hibiscus syriacus]|uniref:DUF4378 domain-containing protein n=1 Tax=Hibiscus syriacus TaxID=106335 RepID=A0A6A2Y6Y4_HIBSY|nr:Detected protein of unknown function [Hibiscus syriacus]